MLLIMFSGLEFRVRVRVRVRGDFSGVADSLAVDIIVCWLR